MDAEFTCTICLTKSKQKGHMMCPDCKKDYEKFVLKMLESQKAPESIFQYTKRITQDNLSDCRKQLLDLTTSFDAFWDKACKEIKRDCSRVRLSKENFLSAVKVRYNLLIEKSHGLKAVEKMNLLKKNVCILGQQMNWFAKIEQQKQAVKENVA
jgi:hypothetical protein